MSLPDNRKELTIEEADELVRFYVSYFWNTYGKSLRGSGETLEDVVMDILLKMVSKHDNRDYDPNWKPGEPTTITKGRGSSERKVEIDTSYMLEPSYNPEDPYDSLYHLKGSPEFTYLTKYDGRTTSKKYYIQGIVQTTLIDMTRKRDLNRYTVSMDDEDDEGLSLGDRVPDPSTIKDNNDFQSKVGDILKRIIKDLPLDPLSDRIVGWSPITGQTDSDGNKIDTHLTARDIGLFILNSYEPSDIVKYYKDTRTGENVSLSTIRKKWNDALNIMRNAAMNDEELISTGYLDGIINREA